ncbi:MAG: DUF4199 domain-containing protein [Bacteroidales bacterium]|jgi:hypothetical protein|nr:DUF4199 domain-containing protein [Bacteroidales bacterium]
MNVWKNRLLYGASAGLILLVYHIILQVAGISFSGGIMGFLNFAIVTSLYIIAMAKGIRRYSNDHLEGYVSFNQAFSHGFFIYFIAAFIDKLRDWVNVSFLGGKQEMIAQMESTDIMENFYDKFGAESYDAILSMAEKMYAPIPYLFITIFNVAISALIIALIVAAFTKKERPF